MRALKLNASQIALIGFCAITLLGGALLALPIAQTEHPHTLLDAMFVATSAVSSTGLSPTDLMSRYSLFGQGVIVLLMQIGGLGYMALFTLSMLLIGQRISLRDRLNLQEALDQPGMAGITRFIVQIVGLSMLIEGIATALLMGVMVPEFGWAQGTIAALLHAVGAYTNAGFPLLPEGMIHWQRQAGVLLVVGMTTVLGGLGFNVTKELVRRYLLRRPPQQRWNVLITIVLGLTIGLLVVSTLVFWVFEARNPKTLGTLPWHLQLVNAFFMATQPRSCGFNSVDVGAMARPSLMLMLALMFIGGGPGSTASGIKLTTVAVTFAGVQGVLEGRKEISFDWFKRRIDERLVRKAYTVVLLSLALVAFSTLIIASLESASFLAILFEVLSAFGNAGLSMGITGQLGAMSKVVLIVTMLMGRVGMITVMLALFPSRKRSVIRYVEEPLLIG